MDMLRWQNICLRQQLLIFELNAFQAAVAKKYSGETVASLRPDGSLLRVQEV
jgi:hypothetical protein